MIKLVCGLPNGLLAVVTDQDEIYVQQSFVDPGGNMRHRWILQSNVGLPAEPVQVKTDRRGKK